MSGPRPNSKQQSLKHATLPAAPLLAQLRVRISRSPAQGPGRVSAWRHRATNEKRKKYRNTIQKRYTV